VLARCKLAEVLLAQGELVECRAELERAKAALGAEVGAGAEEEAVAAVEAKLNVAWPRL